MRNCLIALVLLTTITCWGAVPRPAQAGTNGTACNRFILQGTFFDQVHGYYVRDYFVEDGSYAFCWQYFQRIPGTYPAPDPALAFLFLPPPPPNNRPHGALVALYSFDYADIAAHRGTHPLPPMYTFDGGSRTVRGIGVGDADFSSRRDNQDLVVWDVFAKLEFTAGGPGSHYQGVFAVSALQDYLNGWLIYLPAHSGY